MKRTGLALVGFGAWGQQHAQSIASCPELELRAIACHGDASAAAAALAYPGAVIVRDWRDAVSRDDIGVVDVAAPNFMHADIAIGALRAGRDVLLEKPMATTIEDCDRLIVAERESGRLVSIGHELRQSAQWARVKALIDDDTIGDPLYVNINLFRNFYRSGADGWRYDRARVGSWLLEEAVHYFDLALWYCERHGDPIAIRAWGNQRPGRDQGMYDNVSIVLRFASGAYVTFNQSVAGFEHHLSVDIAGVDGAIRTHWSGTMDRDHSARYELRVQRRGFPFERGVNECETIAIAKSGEVYELTEQIRRGVAAFGERRALVPTSEARMRVAICIEAERSIVEGREIALSSGESAR